MTKRPKLPMLALSDFNVRDYDFRRLTQLERNALSYLETHPNCTFTVDEMVAYAKARAARRKQRKKITAYISRRLAEAAKKYQAEAEAQLAAVAASIQRDLEWLRAYEERAKCRQELINLVGSLYVPAGREPNPYQKERVQRRIARRAVSRALGQEESQ